MTTATATADLERDLAKVLDHLDRNAAGRVEELFDLLRIPSVSTLPDRTGDVRRAGERVRDALARAGLEARLFETPRHPIVHAEWKGAPGRPTVLVYGHYDVQPAEPLELWKTPAFEPDVRDGNIYARGATDDKGQMYAWVKAAAAWMEACGRLPVNVKFLIEGEEEIGSPNLEPFLHEQKDLLAADCVLISDTDQFAEGIPAITYSLRGLLYTEIRVHGPSRDLHSGQFGGSLRNPANALCEIIAGLKDPKTGRVLVDGFYDRVRPIEAWEREQLAKLPFDEPHYRADLAVPELYGEEGFSTLERRWCRPTLDVNGIFGGFQGPGAKTIIPAWAGAKVSMRLVADQKASEIAKGFERTVMRLAQEGVRVEVKGIGDGSDPVLVPIDTPWVQAAKRAVRRGFGADPIFKREGGSIPIAITFKRLLGMDSVFVGYGLPDDGAHSPNEKMKLEDYHRGTRTSAILLAEVAGSRD